MSSSGEGQNWLWLRTIGLEEIFNVISLLIFFKFIELFGEEKVWTITQNILHGLLLRSEILSVVFSFCILQAFPKCLLFLHYTYIALTI